MDTNDADTMAAIHRQRREVLAEIGAASVLDVQAIAENSPLLSAGEVQHLTREADRIIAERLAALGQLREDKAKGTTASMDRLQGDITEANDDLRSLPDRIQAGAINLKDALKELDEVLRLRDNAQRELEGLRGTAERIAEEEEDPLAVLRAFERKWPALKSTIHGGMVRLAAHDPHAGSRGRD